MAKAMIGISEALGGLSAVEGPFMVNFTSIWAETDESFHPAYDWSWVKTVCDVGAGIGHFSRALLQAKSDVLVTMLDLPGTIENTKQVAQ